MQLYITIKRKDGRCNMMQIPIVVTAYAADMRHNMTNHISLHCTSNTSIRPSIRPSIHPSILSLPLPELLIVNNTFVVTPDDDAISYWSLSISTIIAYAVALSHCIDDGFWLFHSLAISMKAIVRTLCNSSLTRRCNNSPSSMVGLPSLDDG